LNKLDSKQTVVSLMGLLTIALLTTYIDRLIIYIDSGMLVLYMIIGMLMLARDNDMLVLARDNG
jgi:hypothetical protein